MAPSPGAVLDKARKRFSSSSARQRFYRRARGEQNLALGTALTDVDAQMTIDDMVDRAVAAVKRWSGARALAAAMEAVPTVDVYLAGGAVRDTLVRRPVPEDFDLFILGSGCDALLEFQGRYTYLARVIRGWFRSVCWM